MDERSRRLRAGAVLSRLLGTQGMRRMFGQHDHPSASEIIIALDDDTIDSVFKRAQRYEPPVTVAIFFEASSAFRFLSLHPGTGKGRPPAPVENVGGTSTIGMLHEYVEKQKRGKTTLMITNWQPITVEELAPV